MSSELRYSERLPGVYTEDEERLIHIIRTGACNGAYSYIPKWIDIASRCVCMENGEERCEYLPSSERLKKDLLDILGHCSPVYKSMRAQLSEPENKNNLIRVGIDYLEKHVIVYGEMRLKFFPHLKTIPFFSRFVIANTILKLGISNSGDQLKKAIDDCANKIGDPRVHHFEREMAIDRAFTEAMVSARITRDDSSARAYSKYRRRALLISLIVSAYSERNPDAYTEHGALHSHAPAPLAACEELEFNARQDAHLIELVQPNWGKW